MAKAIVAIVSGAFQLRNAVPRESVSGPAYAPYVQGLDLLRQDANANAEKAIPVFQQAIQFDPKSACPMPLWPRRKPLASTAATARNGWTSRHHLEESQKH